MRDLKRRISFRYAEQHMLQSEGAYPPDERSIVQIIRKSFTLMTPMHL